MKLTADFAKSPDTQYKLSLSVDNPLHGVKTRSNHINPSKKPPYNTQSIPYNLDLSLKFPYCQG